MIGVVGNLADHIASCRYRVKIPREYSKYEWDNGPSDITIFTKFGTTPGDMNVPGVKLYDVCDDHFCTEKRQHLIEMINKADVVTCTNSYLKDRIQKETGRIAHIITDPVEYPTQSVCVGEPKRLLWFGQRPNLAGIQKIIDELSFNYEVAVISDAIGYIPWSHENMRKYLDWCDVVIIPKGSTGPNAEAKSPNRMTESINAGRFVVANPIPAYEGYGMYLGDIFEGLEWLQDNQQQALKKLMKAQQIVQEKHAPEAIASQWDALFDSILLAEKSIGKVMSM